MRRNYAASDVLLGQPIVASGVRVDGGLDFLVLMPGLSEFYCGSVDGRAYCFGDNSHGTLGDGTRTSREAPAPVAGDQRFTSLAVGPYPCGLTAAGAAYCWGNTDGSAFPTAQLVPTLVAGAPPFTTLVVAYSSACGLTVDGAAYCWGSNASGHLGDGTRTSRWTPAPVAGNLRFASLSAEYTTVCGVTRDGKAYCWGANGGLIGDGTLTDRLTPTLVKNQLP
jgi:alpha-tubulin suppressor-like RCC1 family protein